MRRAGGKVKIRGALAVPPSSDYEDHQGAVRGRVRRVPLNISTEATEEHRGPPQDSFVRIEEGNRPPDPRFSPIFRGPNCGSATNSLRGRRRRSPRATAFRLDLDSGTGDASRVLPAPQGDLRGPRTWVVAACVKLRQDPPARRPPAARDFADWTVHGGRHDLRSQWGVQRAGRRASARRPCLEKDRADLEFVLARGGRTGCLRCSVSWQRC